jgi:single-strand DNA-binding protein
MASVNKVILVGNLGKDPELKYLPSGSPVCNFSIATTEIRKDQENKTDWHNIVVWGKTAEACSHFLRKGSQVFVEGRVSYQSWDKGDGEKGYKTEISASNVQFLGKKIEEDSF